MAEMQENFTLKEESKDHRSKIVSIHIENFMSIKEADITFDDRNIISLCGYNDSGKSATTRLLEVMLFNAYPKDQAKFITDGEDYWKGVLTFSDGVVYTRMKYADSKSFWEMKKDGKVVVTNKLPNGTFAALEGNPEIIEKYLGVLKEEVTQGKMEEINVRRNSDKLLLVQTGGGDNYKILNGVLKSEVLSQASAKLNEDKNKLSKDIDSKTTVKGVLQEQYEELEVAPEHHLDNLEEMIKVLESSNSRLSDLSNLMDSCSEYHSISIPDKVDGIDTSRLIDLHNIISSFKATKLSIYESLSAVSFDRLKELQNIIKLKKELKVDSYDELEKIDIERIKSILETCELFNTYSGVCKLMAETESKLKEAKDKLLQLSSQYNLKVCKNCGSIVD